MAGNDFFPSARPCDRARHQELGRLLVERLLFDGAEKGITIQDVEALVSPYKTTDGRSPKFMHAIVIDLMICLRAKYAVK